MKIFLTIKIYSLNLIKNKLHKDSPKSQWNLPKSGNEHQNNSIIKSINLQISSIFPLTFFFFPAQNQI